METTDGVGHFLYLYISTNTLFRQIYKNQYSRGLQISSPANSFSPLSSFWQAKTRFYLFLTGSGKPACSKKKCTPRGAFFFIFSRNLISSEAMKAHSANSGLPRAENLFTRKFLQPAFEFLPSQKLASISSSQAQANQVARKKNAPRGAHFFSSFHETLFLSQQAKHILA